MKKVLFTFAAVAATLCTVACNKDLTSNSIDQNPAKQDGDKCELRVGISTSLTKSTTITDEDQEKVKNLQVFVFRGDALDAYASVDQTLSAKLSCTAGERTVYVLANEPDHSDISSKTAFLALVSDLSNYPEKGIAMIGSKDVTLPAQDTVSVDAYRLASRVVLKKITRDFTSSALAGLEMEVKDIYLSNVPTDFNYALNSTPSKWVNKMGLDDNGKSLTIWHDAPNAKIANEASDTTKHTFLAYPNPTESDSNGGTWSARHTRLVVKVGLGDKTYYYPITLPKLEYNKSYEISELTLTRPGSDSEDTPVSFQDATFKINVKPWTVVPVTDGTTL